MDCLGFKNKFDISVLHTLPHASLVTDNMNEPISESAISKSIIYKSIVKGTKNLTVLYSRIVNDCPCKTLNLG